MPCSRFLGRKLTTQALASAGAEESENENGICLMSWEKAVWSAVKYVSWSFCSWLPCPIDMHIHPVHLTSVYVCLWLCSLTEHGTSFMIILLLYHLFICSEIETFLAPFKLAYTPRPSDIILSTPLVMLLDWAWNYLFNFLFATSFLKVIAKMYNWRIESNRATKVDLVHRLLDHFIIIAKRERNLRKRGRGEGKKKRSYFFYLKERIVYNSYIYSFPDKSWTSMVSGRWSCKWLQCGERGRRETNRYKIEKGKSDSAKKKKNVIKMMMDNQNRRPDLRMRKKRSCFMK